jgi:PAS domain S-box-containing protein
MPARDAWPDAYPTVAAELRQVMERGEASWHENALVPIYRHGRMEEVYWTYSYSPIHAPDAPNGIGGVLALVTETTGAVVERRTREERYRTLFESVDQGFCIVQLILDADGRPHDYRFVEINRVFEQQTGLHDALGRTARELVPGLEPGWVEAYGRVALTGEPTRFVDHAPSMGRWFDVYAVRIGDPSERQVAILFSDITARKRSEAALRESEARFRHMADSAPALIWMSDDEGRVTFANMHYEYMFGRPAADMLDSGWADIVLPDDLDRHTQTFLDAFNARAPFNCETRVIDKKGQVRWLQCEGVPRFDDAQRFLGYTGCNVDITETKVAEERRDLLIHELNHRVKNTLATVQSIAAQTLRNAATTDEARGAIEARLIALSRAHDVLTRENWEGAWIHEVIGGAMAPFLARGENRLRYRGTDIRLAPRTALALAMAFQELATNAVKYGALSNETGTVDLSWLLDHSGAIPRLFLRWEESGGPQVVPPSRRGFGSRLIERSLAQDLAGHVSITFPPTGVVCIVDAPLPEIADGHR